jgi:acyl carrier protein phosphodiesterase
MAIIVPNIRKLVLLFLALFLRNYMNHNAHLQLSFPHPDLMVGNFVADFVKNKDVIHFTEPVQMGVRMHRAIDYFTDTHELAKKATSLMHPYFRKYAPVALDLYFDFFLIKHWNTFQNNVSHEEFRNECYKVLISYEEIYPSDLKRSLPRMIQDDWLMRFGNYEDLQGAFNRLEKRTVYDSNFKVAVEVLKKYQEELDLIFLDFYPLLKNHVSNFLIASK